MRRSRLGAPLSSQTATCDDVFGVLDSPQGFPTMFFIQYIYIWYPPIDLPFWIVFAGFLIHFGSLDLIHNFGHVLSKLF